MIRSWPSITAFMPEPHTLLIVVRRRRRGMSAPIAAWRAGAWPRPAGSTQPMITSSTWSAARPGVGERAVDRGSAERRRGHAGELAEEGADGGALGTDDDDIRGKNRHGIRNLEVRPAVRGTSRS